jgi:hypothetical protein
LDFDGIHAADEVLNKLRSLQKEYLIDLEDACVVERETDGKVHADSFGRPDEWSNEGAIQSSPQRTQRPQRTTAPFACPRALRAFVVSLIRWRARESQLSRGRGRIRSES